MKANTACIADNGYLTKGQIMKCKWNECENEARSKSPFCSQACKKRHHRASGTDHACVVVHVPVERVSGTVYGRPAIKCSQHGTRPEPLDLADYPHKGGRGRYTRPDGSEYQFDCCGKVFELTNGLVYQTVADVRKCFV